PAASVTAAGGAETPAWRRSRAPGTGREMSAAGRVDGPGLCPVHEHPPLGYPPPAVVAAVAVAVADEHHVVGGVVVAGAAVVGHAVHLAGRLVAVQVVVGLAEKVEGGAEAGHAR